MAKDIVLTAEAREATGRSVARRLREDGLLPGTIYGPGIEPRSLAVPRLELLKVLQAHGAHPLVTVKVDGDQDYLALVKDLQVDPVKRQALHVDFHRVEEDREVETESTITLVGTPAGVKVGGILETVVRSVSISALPRSIPDTLELDVSALDIGDAARVSDLKIPDGVRVLADPNDTVCTVVAPKVEEDAPLSAEEQEILSALTEEELAELQEYAAAVAEAAPEEGEEGAPDAESGDDAAPSGDGDDES